MKIYVYDMTWAGCIVVTANSKEEAVKLISEIEEDARRGKYQILPEDIEEHELEGFSHYNRGDNT